MTEDKILEKMVTMFGDKLCNPEHEPRQFKFQYKMAKWEIENIDTKESSNDGSDGVRSQD